MATDDTPGILIPCEWVGETRTAVKPDDWYEGRRTSQPIQTRFDGEGLVLVASIDFTKATQEEVDAFPVRFAASTHPDHGDPVRLTLEDGTTIWGYLDLPSGNWRSLDHVTVSAVGWTPATWERALCVQLAPGDVVRLTSGAIATVSRVERTGIGVRVEAFGPTVRLRLFARAHERQTIARLTEDTP